MRWAAALILIWLNLADLILTRVILTFGGEELNPWMLPFVDGVGPDGWLLKGVAVAAVALTCAWYAQYSTLVRRGLYVVTGIYFAIVSWNLALIGAFLG